MMDVLEAMRYVEHLGHEFSLEGDNLRISKAKDIPIDLIKQIQEVKQEIVDILKRDGKARRHNLLIGIPGALYFCDISRHSTVYIDQIENEWQAWRETYGEGKEIAISTKTLAQSNSFDYVIGKVDSYLGYISRFRKEWSK